MHGQTFSDTAKLIINYATASIGQKSIDPIIAKVAVEVVADDIKRYYKTRDANFFKLAVKYGSKKNDVSSISGSVITRWLDQYNKEIWLPQNKNKIHNQEKEKPQEKMIGKQMTPQNEIIMHFKWWQKGSIAWSGVKVYQALKKIGLHSSIWTPQQKWDYVDLAGKSLLNNCLESDFSSLRQVKRQIKEIDKNNPDSVSTQIKSQAQRMMIEDWFKTVSLDDLEILL